LTLLEIKTEIRQRSINDMAETPTQSAEGHFRQVTDAATRLYMGNTSKESTALGIGLSHLAQGLADLSVGLRATYKKLEELEALIKRQ
jgi:hypothetical protein